MEIGLLGPFQVLLDGERLRLGGPRQRAVLACLALQLNRTIPRGRLVELVWGAERPETAAGVLQTYVANLRRALEPAPHGGQYQIIASRAGGYELCLPASAVDLNRFESGVTAGREALAAGDHRRAESLLTAALSLWRGAALGEFASQPFAIGPVRRLEDLRLAAAEDRIEARLALAKHHELVPELEDLLHEEPLRERLAGQLMIALYRSGRQAEASDIFQRTRQRLVEEAGMEPSQELQQLLLRVLRQDPRLNLPGPAPIAGQAGNRAPGANRPVLRVGEIEFALAGDESLVGRRSMDGTVSPDVDLAPLDPLRRVSRRHALILHREGAVFLRDLGSLNGTTYNGNRLGPEVDQPLDGGDRIAFGGVAAIYLSADDATQGTVSAGRKSRG